MRTPYQLAVASYMLLALWALCTPSPIDEPPRIPFLFQAAHMGLFGGMAVLIGLGFRRSRPGAALGLLFVIPILSAASYGLILECVQIIVPPRTFQWSDAGFNLAGALLAQVAFLRLCRAGVVPAADARWLGGW